MKSRVIGIIKFESPRMDGGERHGGLNFSVAGEPALESWLAALVASGDDRASSLRWESRGSIVPAPRRVRANLERLAEDLDREYVELAAS